MTRFYSTFKRLCEEKDISPNAAAKELGLSSGSVTAWKQGRTPKFATVQKIADYFSVDVEDFYLSEEKRTQQEIEEDNIRWEGIQIGLKLSREKGSSLPKGAIPFESNCMAPVLGRIPAGYPVFAQEEVVGYHPINVPNPEECFWLVVHGDSMVDAGIESGDWVLIRRQNAAENGQIVACRVNGDDATLKRFHQQGENVILYPANAKYQPIIVPKSDFQTGQASIIGVVIEMLRKF